MAQGTQIGPTKSTIVALGHHQCAIRSACGVAATLCSLIASVAVAADFSLGTSKTDTLSALTDGAFDQEGVTSFGYRIRKLTPFLAYATVHGVSRVSMPRLPEMPAPAPIDVMVRAAQTADHSIQRTTSFGMRWDVTSNMDLRAQFDRVALIGTPWAFAHNATTGDHSRMMVFGLSADFSF